jgi:hypothetical protein
MTLSPRNLIKLSLILALLIALIAIIINSVVPDIADKYEKMRSPHLWRIGLELNSAPTTVHTTTVGAALERSLKSLSEVERLTITTTPNRVTAHFYTQQNVVPRDFLSTINAKINTLQGSQTLPEFEPVTFYEAFSKVKTVGTRLDSLRSPQIQTLSNALESATNQNRGNPLATASFDLVIRSKNVNNTAINLDELDLFLQRLHTIHGIQKAYARNVNLSFVKVDLDPRQLLQIGISPRVVHKTIANHLRIDPGISETILGRKGYIFRDKSESIEELCNLSFSSNITGSFLRICDVAKVSTSPIKMDFYTVGSSLTSLERRLRDQNRSPTENNAEPASIGVLLHSDASPSDVSDAINEAIEKTSQNGIWEIGSEDIFQAKPLHLVLLVLAASLLAVLFFLVKSEFSQVSLFVFLMAQILVFWSGTTYALGVDTSFQMLSTPFLVAALTHTILRCLSLLRDLHGARGAPITYASLVLALLVATVASRTFVNSSGENAQNMFSNIAAAVGGLYALLLAPHTPESRPLQTPHFTWFQKLKGGTLSTALPALGILLLLLPTVKYPGTMLIALGFEGGTSLDTAQQVASQIERIARANKSTSVIAAPERTSVVKLKPSTFGLLNRVPIPLEDGLNTLRPSVPGEVNLRSLKDAVTRHPVIITSVFPEFKMGAHNEPQEESIFKFRKWLDTLQQPLVGEFQKTTVAASAHNARKNFLPMSALVVPEWSRELTGITRTDLGETTLAEIRSSEMLSGFQSQVDDYLKSLSSQTKSKIDVLKSNTIEEIRNLNSQARFGALMLSIVLFLCGILFFGSTERAILTLITFLAIHVSVSGIFHLISIPHGPEKLSSLLSFPSQETWTSVLLTAQWAILLRTADYRRAMNMTLTEAFALQKQITGQFQHWFRLPVLLLTVAGLADERFALLAATLFSFWSVSGLFLHDWMLLWTKLSEWKNRALLKLRIHHTTTTLFSVLLIFTCLTPNQLRAEADTSILNSTCEDTVTIVLPILGRPKGKEPVPQRTFLSERLAQEIPCAWVGYGFAQDMIKIHEGFRSTASQSRIVTALGDFVNKNRNGIEGAAIAHLQRINKKTSTQVRVLGGFYEEFLGSITFTILDFYKNREPVITKVSSSEEQQTQTVSKIALYLRGENTQLHEEILGEASRLPVYFEPVESLDKHPVSENIAGEVELFLSSRFLNPMSSNLLERKTFFRLERNQSAAKFILNVKIRRDETRLYASLTARSRDGSSRRSAWIEGEVSRFAQFEEEILNVARRTLSNIEDIADYTIALGSDFWATKSNDLSRMYTLYFRQNLGNAALSARLRSGTILATDRHTKLSLFGGGGALGWQFFDIRWMTGDMGISLDGGLISSSSESSSRDIWMSYGGYSQLQTSLGKNFVIIGRAGIEQPQRLGGNSNDSGTFQSYYWNGFIGVGVIF